MFINSVSHAPLSFQKRNHESKSTTLKLRPALTQDTVSFSGKPKPAIVPHIGVNCSEAYLQKLSDELNLDVVKTVKTEKFLNAILEKAQAGEIPVTLRTVPGHSDPGYKFKEIKTKMGDFEVTISQYNQKTFLPKGQGPDRDLITEVNIADVKDPERCQQVMQFSMVGLDSFTNNVFNELLKVCDRTKGDYKI